MISLFKNPFHVSIETFEDYIFDQFVCKFKEYVSKNCNNAINIEVINLNEYKNLKANRRLTLNYFNSYENLNYAFKHDVSTLSHYNMAMYDYNNYIMSVYNKVTKHDASLEKENTIYLYNNASLYSKYIEFSLKYISTHQFLFNYNDKFLIKEFALNNLKQKDILYPSKYNKNLLPNPSSFLDYTVDLTSIKDISIENTNLIKLCNIINDNHKEFDELFYRLLSNITYSNFISKPKLPFDKIINEILTKLNIEL